MLIKDRESDLDSCWETLAASAPEGTFQILAVNSNLFAVSTSFEYHIETETIGYEFAWWHG